MNNMQKLTLVFFIFISFYSCENIYSNKAEVSDKDSVIEGYGEEDYACFYRESTSLINKTYPFSAADKIEVVSHLSPFLAQDSKDDSIQVGSYLIKGIKERITLKKEQTDSLFSILYNYRNRSGVKTSADCDEPRHSIIFYKKSKPISYIDICLECQKVHYPKQTTLPSFCSEKWKMLEDHFKNIGIKSGFMDTISGRIVEFEENQKIIQFIPPAIEE